jgi:hypothetical protein
MATIKKTAKPTKKPAAKKPAAKKPAAKKPAAKKPAAKKPAVKKTVAKKPAAKKPAVKKPAAKKPAVKKPAAKPAAKKPAVKPAAVKKEAPKVAVAKKPAVKAAPEPQKPAAPAGEQEVRYRNLFEAYNQQKLPFSQGYIVSSFFKESSTYSIIEIVSYAAVKEIYSTGDGLTFVTGGKKLYILVEPDTYHNKPVEPVSRSKTDGEYIPKRFSELETIIAKNQTRIMVAKEPEETFGSFTVLEPKGINFSIVFYDHPDVINTLGIFLQNTLNRQRKVPEGDAKKAAKLITDIVLKTMSSEGQFQ